MTPTLHSGAELSGNNPSMPDNLSTPSNNTAAPNPPAASNAAPDISMAADGSAALRDTAVFTNAAAVATPAVAASPRVAGAPYPVTPATEAGQTRSWPRIVGYSALGTIVVALGISYGMYASWQNGGTIAPGIVIQGEKVGGLSPAEAKARLQKRFGRLFVEVAAPERTYRMSLKELGGEPQINKAVLNAAYYGRSGGLISNGVKLWQARQEDQRLRLPVKWDKARLRSKMWTVATLYNQKSRDAQLRVTDAGVQVVPHQEGRSLNVGATLQKLQKKYFVGLPDVEATVRKDMPRITSADLAGRDIKMGQYTTYFDSGLWGRTRNIEVASMELDGKVLMPGEKFSFNAITGERTWDKGYRMAHIFERKPGKSEAEVVDGLAGGVCQVSSTLYNAVRKANNRTNDQLRIIERNYHSLPVTYVPTGLDATVAWPHKDFRFRNTFPHPVYLRAAVSGSRLTVSVWGRVPENVNTIAMSPEEAKPSNRQASNF